MIRTNLKYILEEREISIRELERRTGERYETLRRMVNNKLTQFPNMTLFRVCSVLNIEIGDLLYVDYKHHEADVTDNYNYSNKYEKNKR